MKFRQTREAREDIEEALFWSALNFGRSAARRYRDLIEVSIREIVSDPELAGSKSERGLQRGIRIYHLSHSRKRAAVDGLIVKRPRHFVVYRIAGSGLVEIVRLLHDSMDLKRRF